ncbi:hypothetical protein PVAP13_6KG300112 [Panicum virgatum]|uniref:Uncharacterized protein n=1 Tax=Panicum virgatum TaxID=38727 RepID=A0A8T0REJ8_PANVG|nr:hypothetical protein PVAP13_6KG300112 [Panicum virgatum]
MRNEGEETGQYFTASEMGKDTAADGYTKAMEAGPWLLGVVICTSAPNHTRYLGCRSSLDLRSKR